MIMKTNKWLIFLPGSPVQPQRDDTEFSWQSKITQRKATKTLAGKYTCTAYPHGNESHPFKSINITVDGESHIINFLLISAKHFGKGWINSIITIISSSSYYMFILNKGILQPSPLVMAVFAKFY